MKNQIANTIFNQMGGNKIHAMIGMKDLVADGNALQFGFKGCRKANKCRVILNDLDLYDVEFYKYNRRTFECPKIKSVNNVYADQLNKTFENFTGLATSL